MSQERSQPASAQPATAQTSTASAQPTVGASTSAGASGASGPAPAQAPKGNAAQKSGGGNAGSWEFDDGLKDAMGLGAGGAAPGGGGQPHGGLGGGAAKPAKPEASGGGEHKDSQHGGAHGPEAAPGSPAHGKGGQDPGHGAGKGAQPDIKGDLRKAMQGKTPDIDAMLAGIDRATPQQCQAVLDDKALIEELRALLGSDKMERVVNRLRARTRPS